MKGADLWIQYLDLAFAKDPATGVSTADTETANNFLKNVVSMVRRGDFNVEDPGAQARLRRAGGDNENFPVWWVARELGPFDSAYTPAEISEIRDKVFLNQADFPLAHFYLTRQPGFSVDAPVSTTPATVAIVDRDGVISFEVKQPDGTISATVLSQPPAQIASQVIDGNTIITTSRGQTINLGPAPTKARYFEVGDSGLLLTQDGDGNFRVLDRGEPTAKQVTIGGQDFVQLGESLQPLPEPTGQADRRRSAILGLDEQIDEAITQGNMDFARALTKVRDAPTDFELFDAAMQFAKSPADSLILQNIQRGLAGVDVPAGELGALPRPAFLRDRFSDLLADPFENPGLLNPPANIKREQDTAKLQRVQQLLSRIEQIETRLGELTAMPGVDALVNSPFDESNSRLAARAFGMPLTDVVGEGDNLGGAFTLPADPVQPVEGQATDPLTIPQEKFVSFADAARGGTDLRLAASPFDEGNLQLAARAFGMPVTPAELRAERNARTNDLRRRSRF